MKQTATQIQKSITLSSQLYHTAEAKAQQLGVPFAEYLRHLIIKDTKNKVEDIPMVDEETEKRIGESLKAYKEGRYIQLDPFNEEEMNKFFGLK